MSVRFDLRCECGLLSDFRGDGNLSIATATVQGGEDICVSHTV